MIWQAIAPVGREAENPYYFEKLYINIYSIEELCYALFENAFLIDNDIVDKGLADWIYKECGLTDLASTLYSLINQHVQAVAFVGTILDYVGYYSPEEIKKAESILRLNVSMSVFDKWKAKADFLFENKHYKLAIKEYEKILKNIGDDETDLISRVYNNMGVTYMALYFMDKAAECFKKAWETDGNEEAFRHYIAAMRIKLPENEYIRFVSENEQVSKYAIEVESAFEEAKLTFEESEKAKSMKELSALKDTGNAGLYYEETNRCIARLKSDYRDVCLESD
ncbi:MAG: hypothetical protein K6E19_03495 [Lachnospiraceae bacterium]|nr:hypothetical protein [Lachnospiraceae bacterium]